MKSKRNLLKKRVVRSSDKDLKKLQILEVAARLFETNSFTEISMSSVAQKASLAKGTLYLYFETKEELALGVLAAQYQDWFLNLKKYLASIKRLDPKKFSKWFASSLKSRNLFLSLMPLGPSLLESNVSLDYLVQYKTNLHLLLKEAGEMMSTKMKMISPEQASRLLILFHVQVLGLQSYDNLPEKVKNILKQGQLTLLNLSYFDVLESQVLLILKAYIK